METGVTIHHPLPAIPSSADGPGRKTTHARNDDGCEIPQLDHHSKTPDPFELFRTPDPGAENSGSQRILDKAAGE
jgi:hypothetical protein